jgi:hypothetical protein
MSLSSGQVKKLLETTKPIKFNQLAFSLMYTRLKTMYQKSPTAETVNACTQQINDLFAKYGHLMNDDYKLATSI